MTPRKGLIRALVALGIGLALAPVAFKMFERAPKGGDMIEGFGPYMDTAVISNFLGHLDTINGAHSNAVELELAATDESISDFVSAWPGILTDMGGMLNTMANNIGNYRGVAALPPFPLFPWFFVAPGVLLAVFALLRFRAGLYLLGLGLLAAPAVFGMFGRAPGGAEMINDFKPFMTTEKVTEIQGYFLTLAGAEGAFRLDVLPATNAGGIERFVTDWQVISSDMAPMIGAMADNIDNFNAVKALPPFWLFPWFFVIPGLLVLALTYRAYKPDPVGSLVNPPAGGTHGNNNN